MRRHFHCNNAGVQSPPRLLVSHLPRQGLLRPDVVRARRLFCQVAVKGLGHSGAEVARFLGITTSSANRLAVCEELPEFRRFLNAL